MGDAKLVLLPVTVGFNRQIPEYWRKKYRAAPRIVRCALRKTNIIRACWATPAETPGRHLVGLAKTALANHTPLINIMLHSSELMVGGAPKSKTQADVDTIYTRIDALLRTLSESGACEFTTLTAVSRPWAIEKRREVEDAGISSNAMTTERPDMNAPARNPARRNLAYLLSPSYSGSTLLTFLMGTHRQIATIGELKATSMGNVDEYVCSCGTPIRACSFWDRVTQTLRARGVEFDLASFGTHFRRHSHALQDRLLRARARGPLLEAVRTSGMRLIPGCWKAKARIQERNRVLIDAISEIQQADVFLDGSKDPSRLLHLIEAGLWNVQVIYLIRDGRGTAHSYMKHHDVQMDIAARVWRAKHLECDRMVARLPARSHIRIHYENICRDPEGTLTRIYGFLGLDPTLITRDFRSVEHHILGNSMRLRSSHEIALDEKWRKQVSQTDLETFDRIAGSLNRRYGYA